MSLGAGASTQHEVCSYLLRLLLPRCPHVQDALAPGGARGEGLQPPRSAASNVCALHGPLLASTLLERCSGQMKVWGWHAEDADEKDEGGILAAEWR